MVKLEENKIATNDQRKTVAHLVYSFNIGGLERVIANLINSSKQENIRHVIITLVPGHDFVSQLIVETDVYCLDKKPGNDVSSHLRLFNLLRRVKPDILHSYNFGTFEYQVTAFFARVPKRIHAEHGRDGEYDEKTRRRRTIVRKLVLPFVNHFVVVSPDLYRWANTALGVKETKLQLVLNGIDTDVFACDRTVAKHKAITFITVGRLAPIKNQTLLIEAFSELIISQPDMAEAQLHLVGDGPLHEQLSLLIKDKELEKNVVLLGARDDVHELLKKADIFVLSSDYEAMPMTVLESMASGLPVICTDVGGVRNIIKDLDTGLLVPAGDIAAMAAAMNKAFDDKPLLTVIAANAKDVVNEKYSVNAMKQHYQKLYGFGQL